MKIRISLAIYFFTALFQSLSVDINCQTDSLHLMVVNKIAIDSIEKNLFEFEHLGNKEVNTIALKNTANWHYNKYKSYGYSNIELDSFSYANCNLFNLIVTKKGILHPDSFLIVCGHYDTKNGPGVGDNGSGTSIILEIARILKNIDTEISIQFIHFAGEEDGLIGSKHFVKKIASREKPPIKLVFNIDAVGGTSSKINNKIVCESDKNNKPASNNEESLKYTQMLASLVKKYSPLEPVLGNAYGSDYIPFQDEGFIITGLYEFNQSPFAHTPNDKVKNVDIEYIYQVARVAMGAVLHFSGSLENR